MFRALEKKLKKPCLFRRFRVSTVKFCVIQNFESFKIPSVENVGNDLVDLWNLETQAS